MDGWMNHGWMDGCMYVCMYVYMYVYFMYVICGKKMRGDTLLWIIQWEFSVL